MRATRAEWSPNPATSLVGRMRALRQSSSGRTGALRTRALRRPVAATIFGVAIAVTTAAACSAADENPAGETPPASDVSGVHTLPDDCEDTTLAVLEHFFDRYSAGDAGGAAELFAPEPSFEWFTHEQGRLNADEDPWSPYDRDTLVEFFQSRHDAGETIELQSVSDGRVSLGDRNAALDIRFELEGDAFDGIGGVVVQCDTGLIRLMSIGRAPSE